MVQYRKRKKVGPFRFTVSQSGISTSVGAGPLRLSLGADGKVRRTVRIPGAGIYDTKVIGGRTEKPTANPEPTAREREPAPRVAQSPNFMTWYETEATRDFQCWQTETRDGQRVYLAGRRPGHEWHVRECNPDGTEAGAPMQCQTFDDIKREVDTREANRRGSS